MLENLREKVEVVPAISFQKFSVEAVPRPRMRAQVGDTSPETIQFLRTEFARPLNLGEYSESLPVGMEQKAYSLSLMAIKLDT